MKRRILAEIACVAFGAFLGLLASPGSDFILIGALLGFLLGYAIGPHDAAPSPRPARPVRDLALQALGAVGWGLFLVVAPIVEVLVFCSPVWIALLVRREVLRARRYDFMPGFLLRALVVAVIVAAAAIAPMKPLDEEVGPLPPRVRLADLSRTAHHFHYVQFRADDNPEIAIPKERMTYRELMGTIEVQTGLRSRVGGCGCGMNILWGGYPIFIAFGKE